MFSVTLSSRLFVSILVLASFVCCDRKYGPNAIYSDFYRKPNPPPYYSNIQNPRNGPVQKTTSCYNRNNLPIKCTPEFSNAAYHAPIESTNTCGQYGPSQYCFQTDATKSHQKTCEICDQNIQTLAHPPENMIDVNDKNNTITWWQSESLFEGQWPKQVNITLHLGKAFEITHVQLKFYSPRAESFSIYKRTTIDGPWIPFQYYSSNCLKMYNVSNRAYSNLQDQTQALCTKEFSDISPLTGGNVVFTTLEGRPNATHVEYNEKLQEFVTATDIRIVLDNMNTFGDEIFGDEQVLRSYYYAISDLSVGGICKCNGHANKCVSPPGSDARNRRLACQCEHNTTGPDCEKCLPFYNDQPWRRATTKNAYACRPCNCNGKSNKCFFDEALWRKTGHGGHCEDCADNTDGPNCERCKENYFLMPLNNVCTACNCDSIGSVNLQCGGDGQCQCKPGVEGKRCDRCAANYFDFGHTGCRPCGCNVAGSLNNVPYCNNKGKCTCKKNVEGEKCDRCKPGYFDLQFSNEQGCVSCFCYGHSDVCTSAPGYSMYRIESSFNRDSERWIAKDKNGNEVPLQYNSRDKNLVTNTNYQDNPIYLQAPEKFLNDKKYSYNHNISFYLQVTGDGLLTTIDDIIIEGNGLRITASIFNQGNQLPSGVRQRFTYILNEDFEYGWAPQLSTRDFISLLSNLTAIKIKSTYTMSGSGILDDVSLETAISNVGPESDRATWVESCTCPQGYDGQHCDSCAAGYKHDPPRGGKFAKCVPCNCNKHGEYCDSESGRCICNHNTEGDTCDHCKAGYYGDALKGTEDDCSPCPCPNEGRCTILPDKTVACLECPEGFGGRLCDMCIDGYAMNENRCEKCSCNGNIDLNAIGNCDMSNGNCLKCIFNTWGNDCGRCLPGYYGSALTLEKGDCKACSCNSFGTIAEDNFDDFDKAKQMGYLRSYYSNTMFFTCNSVSGQCRCKPNVAGRQCNTCVDGYWDLASSEGCKPCNCDLEGSENRLCSDSSGQCNCKPGVTGKHCDKCLPDHYGFGSDGCHKCDCDPIGSLDSQCDLLTGQCKCRPNVEGKRCEFCQENKYNKEAGCVDCPACYTLVQESVEVHRNKIGELKTLLEEIEQNHQKVEDANFEIQLNKIIDKVHILLQEAKAAQGKDDSLVYQLEQIKSRIRKVQEITQKIYSQIGFIGTEIKHGINNITTANVIAETAETDLNNARSYLESEGRRSLEKARMRSDKYGHQSEKMSKIASEARALADEDEVKTKQIIDRFMDIRNKSEIAYTMAKDAINNQEANKKELEKLKEKLNEVKDQFQMTEKLADNVQNDAKLAAEDSLSLLTEVSGINVPDLDPAKYKSEALIIIAQVKKIKEDAINILKSHEELLNSTGNRLQDVKALFENAQQQQRKSDNLLMEVDMALNQTNEAVLLGENVLKEAKNTLNTLKEFDSHVQQSKLKADQAMSRVTQINKDIEDAIAKAGKDKIDLDTALGEAINARDIAKNAEASALQASSESKKIREDAQQTKSKVSELGSESQTLLRNAEQTSQRMKGYEDKAALEETVVNDSLKLANTAKTSAQDAIRKVANATRTVEEILRNLSGMDDMDEKNLSDLEQLLRDAEKKLKSSDLDNREKQLSQLNKEQKSRLRDYEDEVNKLADDVSNISKIRESLPNGCFRSPRLEP